MMLYDAEIAIEGLYHEKTPNKIRLGLCSKSGDVLEPMITPQWYANYNGMAVKGEGREFEDARIQIRTN